MNLILPQIMECEMRVKEKGVFVFIKGTPPPQKNYFLPTGGNNRTKFTSSSTFKVLFKVFKL